MTPDPRIVLALHQPGLQRIPGTAVFVFPLGEIDAGDFVRYVWQHRVLAGQVLLVRVVTGLEPHVPVERQARSQPIGEGAYLTTIQFGYDDWPDVPLALASGMGPSLDWSSITYIVSQERIDRRASRAMWAWQKWLFGVMLRRSESAASYLRIPAAHVTRLTDQGTNR